jgi:molybdopterin converting factor small subunit
MSVLTSIKTHIKLIKELISLYTEMKAEVGSIDSVSDIKTVIATVKEMIAELKQYKAIKAELESEG